MGRFMQQQGGQTLFGQEETLRKTRLILEERPATACQGEGEQDRRGANKHSQVQLQTIICLTTHTTQGVMCNCYVSTGYWSQQFLQKHGKTRARLQQKRWS